VVTLRAARVAWQEKDGKSGAAEQRKSDRETVSGRSVERRRVKRMVRRVVRKRHTGTLV